MNDRAHCCLTELDHLTASQGSRNARAPSGDLEKCVRAWSSSLQACSPVSPTPITGPGRNRQGKEGVVRYLSIPTELESTCIGVAVSGKAAFRCSSAIVPV